MVHYRKVLKDRIRGELPALIHAWQTNNPGALLPAPFVTENAALFLDVSRATVAKHLTDAVAEGGLVEVLMYRTRLVVLHGSGLPPLYAVEGDGVYELVTERPNVRGSDGVSFIITPDDYKKLIRRQQRIHKRSIPAPREE